MTARRLVLMDAVRLLASDAATQIAHLEQLGDGVEADELVLELDDIASACDDMLANMELSAGERPAVQRLSACASEMTATAEMSVWRRAALAEHEQWRKLRRQAAECYAVLSGGAPKPD